MSLRPIAKMQTPWMGLWGDEAAALLQSQAINLAVLKDFKGTVRFYIKKNPFYKNKTKRPNYVMMIKDTNAEKPVVLELSKEEKTYTRDEVLEIIKGLYTYEALNDVKHGVAYVSRNGYDGDCLDVEDYARPVNAEKFLEEWESERE